MRLPDLLELGLDLLDSLILEILDFFQRVLDRAQRFRIDLRRRQQLVDLRVLCLETFLYRFQLFLEHQVP